MGLQGSLVYGGLLVLLLLLQEHLEPALRGLRSLLDREEGMVGWRNPGGTAAGAVAAAEQGDTAPWGWGRPGRCLGIHGRCSESLGAAQNPWELLRIHRNCSASTGKAQHPWELVRIHGSCSESMGTAQHPWKPLSIPGSSSAPPAAALPLTLVVFNVSFLQICLFPPQTLNCLVTTHPFLLVRAWNSWEFVRGWVQLFGIVCFVPLWVFLGYLHV